MTEKQSNDNKNNNNKYDINQGLTVGMIIFIVSLFIFGILYVYNKYGDGKNKVPPNNSYELPKGPGPAGSSWETPATYKTASKSLTKIMKELNKLK